MGDLGTGHKKIGSTGSIPKKLLIPFQNLTCSRCLSFSGDEYEYEADEEHVQAMMA